MLDGAVDNDGSMGESESSDAIPGHMVGLLLPTEGPLSWSILGMCTVPAGLSGRGKLIAS